MKRRRSFTVVELVVTSALLAVVLACLWLVFGSASARIGREQTIGDILQQKAFLHASLGNDLDRLMVEPGFRAVGVGAAGRSMAFYVVRNPPDRSYARLLADPVSYEARPRQGGGLVLCRNGRELAGVHLVSARFALFDRGSDGQIVVQLGLTTGELEGRAGGAVGSFELVKTYVNPDLLPAFVPRFEARGPLDPGAP